MKWIGTLVFSMMSIFAFSQFYISGKILDEENKSLNGATVQLKELQQVAITDSEGVYRFTDIPAGTYTLIFSYVGYATQKETITLSAANPNLTVHKTLVSSPVAFDQIVVRATRATELLPVTFTNLNREEIEVNNLGQDVPFLLKWSPSTVVTSDAGTGIGYTGLRIRGVDPNRINVTINGVPLNDAESQGVFWVNLPDFASSVENIQIQRGVGTSTNGPAAFGASINMNTSKLHAEPYAEISGSAGSFNTLKGNLNFGTGLLNKKFTIDGRMSRIQSDGFIDRASANLSSYYLSGAYTGRKSSLRMNVFSGHEITYQAWNGVPAQYLDDPELRTYNSAGTQRPGEPHDNEVDDYQQQHYQLLYSSQINRNWDFSATANYTRGKGFFELYQGQAALAAYGLSPVVIGETSVTNSDLIERRWLDNDFYFGSLSSNYSSDDEQLNLTLGTSLGHYRGDHFGEVIWARYAGDSEQDFTYYENEGIKTDFAIFGKAGYQFAPRLTGFLDLQYRGINYRFEGKDNDGSPLEQEVDFHFFNPKIGLTFQPNSTNNLYAYFGVGNKEPNRNDFVDASINSRPAHETLYDTEIGWKRTWKKALVEANLYYMDYKNQLVLTGQINDVGAYNRVNIPDSYRAGLELVGGVQLSEHLNLQGATTISRNKIKSFTEYIDNWDTGGQEAVEHEDTDLAFSPGFIGNLALDYELFPGDEARSLAFNLSGKYVGEQYIDNTSNKNTQLPAFGYLDGRVTYELPTKSFGTMTFTLLVRNLLDARYVTNAWTYRYRSAGYDGRPDDPHTRLEGGNTYNLTGFYPQAGRNFLAGVRIRF